MQNRREPKKKFLTDTTTFKMLKRIDVFSKPIQLQFDGKEDYHTYCGASLTFIFALICLVYFMSQIYNYFILANPSVVMGEQPLGNQTVYISEKNFTVLVSMRGGDKLNYIDPTVYSVSAAIKQKRMVASNNQTSSEVITRELQINKCQTIERIPQNSIIQEEIHSYFCLNVSESQLRGQFQDPQFEYISIYVKKCVNNTVPGITCKSRVEIDRILEANILQVVFSDVVLDFLGSYEKIFQPMLGSTHSTYNPINSKEVNIFLQPLTLSQRILDVLPAEYVLIFVRQRYNARLSHVEELGDITTNKQLFQVIFRLTNTQQVYELHNQNIFALFSQLGGLWNFLVILGSIFIGPFRDFSRNLSIINRIFVFEPLKTHLDEKVEISVTSIGMFPKMRLSVIDYLTYFCPSKKCQTVNRQKMNQIEYATQQIWDKLDIIFLLKKLNQLEKLMGLMLNEEQKSKFQELQKKVIRLDVQPEEQQMRKAWKKISKAKRQVVPIGSSDELFGELQSQSSSVDVFDFFEDVRRRSQYQRTEEQAGSAIELKDIKVEQKLIE